MQSALVPNGPAAAAIAELWWIMFGAATVVFLVVCVLLAASLLPRDRTEGAPPPLPTAPGTEMESKPHPPPERTDGAEMSGPERPRSPPREVRLDTVASDRRSVRWVAIGAGITAVILIATLLFTLRTLAAIEDSDAPARLTIEVTGWQWWWEVHYFGAAGGHLFETANEIHLPVGERVRVRLRAGDVIHSFWVPQLAGKLDMIPGRVNRYWIQADEPGIYRGQCAEYCAGPHALMAFPVVAESRVEFRAWVERQRRSAVPPSDPVAARGREVFLNTACARCHAVRGTPADGRLGPDLTHVASRLTLAAGTVPNTPGHLGGWITDPQAIKPGNKMPAVPLGPEELTALLRYLGTLE